MHDANKRINEAIRRIDGQLSGAESRVATLRANMGSDFVGELTPARAYRLNEIAESLRDEFNTPDTLRSAMQTDNVLQQFRNGPTVSAFVSRFETRVSRLDAAVHLNHAYANLPTISTLVQTVEDHSNSRATRRHTSADRARDTMSEIVGDMDSLYRPRNMLDEAIARNPAVPHQRDRLADARNQLSNIWLRLKAENDLMEPAYNALHEAQNELDDARKEQQRVETYLREYPRESIVPESVRAHGRKASVESANSVGARTHRVQVSLSQFDFDLHNNVRRSTSRSSSVDITEQPRTTRAGEVVQRYRRLGATSVSSTRSSSSGVDITEQRQTPAREAADRHRQQQAVRQTPGLRR